MTTTIYPVDSATRICCRAIGGHAPHCRTAAPALPAGAVTATEFDNLGTRAVLGPRLTVPGATVNACAIQGRSGALADDPLQEAPSVQLSLDLHGHLSPAAARQLAAHLTTAADLADTWVAMTRHPAGRGRNGR